MRDKCEFTATPCQGSTRNFAQHGLAKSCAKSVLSIHTVYKLSIRVEQIPTLGRNLFPHRLRSEVPRYALGISQPESLSCFCVVLVVQRDRVEAAGRHGGTVECTLKGP